MPWRNQNREPKPGGTKTGDRRDVYQCFCKIPKSLVDGGPFKPGFGLSGDVHNSQTYCGEQN
jgi:hypothetical protein